VLLLKSLAAVGTAAAEGSSVALLLTPWLQLKELPKAPTVSYMQGVGGVVQDVQ